MLLFKLFMNRFIVSTFIYVWVGQLFLLWNHVRNRVYRMEDQAKRLNSVLHNISWLFMSVNKKQLLSKSNFSACMRKVMKYSSATFQLTFHRLAIVN